MFLSMPSTNYHHNKTHTEITTEIITLPPRPSGGCAHSIWKWLLSLGIKQGQTTYT